MYKLIEQTLWQGREDNEEDSDLASRLHQVIKVSETSRPENKNSSMSLLGFACDEGVKRNKGRVGAAKGPNVLRKAMANLPWKKSRTIVDLGNIVCEENKLEQAHQELADQIKSAYQKSAFVFVLGGGHEIAYGSWLGLVKSLTDNSDHRLNQKIGIINFDAHFDLRSDEYGVSSGTPFYQIANVCEENNWPFQYACFGVSEASNTRALFQRADQMKVTYRYDHQMTLNHLEQTIHQLEHFIEQVDVIYLTICLDVLPASVAPGVSAPAAKGVSLDVIEALVNVIKKSGKLKLADLAEFNPDFDIDHWTARIAARLFYLISYE